MIFDIITYRPKYNDKSILYIYIRLSNNPIYISTSIEIEFDKWDKNRRRVNQFNNYRMREVHKWINDEIRNIERKMHLSRLHYEYRKWTLNDVIKCFKNKPVEIDKRLQERAYNIHRRIEKNILKKINDRLRSNMWSAMKRKGYKKKSRTHEMLGCDYDFFKVYIEKQFKEGMTWENHGKWHFDHIIPVSSARNEEELMKLNHYTNFQPLWAEENLSKSNKLKWTGN